MTDSTLSRASVAGEIRAEIARQNRKPRELVGVLHISQSAVYRRIEGDKSFTVDDLYRIAEWLGVPVSQFLIQERAS